MDGFFHYSCFIYRDILWIEALLLISTIYKIMKKLFIFITLITVVLISPLVFSGKVSADVLVPGQIHHYIPRPQPDNISTSTSNTVVLPAFTNHLQLGSSGQDVKNLQIFLNTQ